MDIGIWRDEELAVDFIGLGNFLFMIPRDALDNGSVKTLSHSQTVLRALQAITFDSAVELECGSVQMGACSVWSSENKLADMLASGRTFTGLELTCGTS